jgi:hypothetical protein
VVHPGKATPAKRRGDGHCRQQGRPTSTSTGTRPRSSCRSASLSPVQGGLASIVLGADDPILLHKWQHRPVKIALLSSSKMASRRLLHFSGSCRLAGELFALALLVGKQGGSLGLRSALAPCLRRWSRERHGLPPAPGHPASGPQASAGLPQFRPPYGELDGIRSPRSPVLSHSSQIEPICQLPDGKAYSLRCA